MKYPGCLHNSQRTNAPLLKAYSVAGLLLSTLLCQGAMAQNAEFNVTVNPGAVAPNSTTVYPGDATSIRIALINDSAILPIEDVSFDVPLPAGPVNGLLVGATAGVISGAGCGGILTTTPGQPGIALGGLTVPAEIDGVADSGRCYLDIPVVAYSTNGVSTTLSYEIAAGAVFSTGGVNASGGTQGITLRQSARPTWNKRLLDGGNPLVLGGASKRLRFRIENEDDNVDLTNVSFTDVFPVGVSGGAVIQPENSGVVAIPVCGGTITLTQGGASQVAVTGVSVPAGGMCDVFVPVVARHTDGGFEAEVTNVIPATGFSSDQGLRPVADARRGIDVQSPLAVRKVFNPRIVASGEPNTFTITLFNNGGTDLGVTDFVDNPISNNVGMLLIGAVTDIDNSCSGGNRTLLDGGQGFSVDGFDIPSNGNCVITITYTGTTPGDDRPTTYTNQILEGAVNTGIPALVSQPQSATVLVADRLRVLKTSSPRNAAPGDPVRYEVAVQNFSTSAISDVRVTDMLQNGSTLLLTGDFSPTLMPAGCGPLGLGGAAEGDSTVTFTIPTLLPRTGSDNQPGECTIAFSAMLDPLTTGRTDNRIEAGDVCYSSSPEICNGVLSGSVSTNYLNTMRVLKQFDGQNSVDMSEGTPSRLQFTVSNNSVGELTSLTLNDTLPEAGSPLQQLRVASPANISNTCGGSVEAVEGTTSVALNDGIVSAYDGSDAGTCVVALDVVGPAGTYNNTVDAAATRHNANGTTTLVVDDDVAQLIYTDALAVAKAFTPTEAGPGGSSTVSIALNNLGSSRPITGIDLSDNLPPGMLVADPSNAYATCSGPTVLSADPGSATVSLSGATLAPLANCEVRFDVVTSGTSEWVNTIPVGGVTADGGLTNLAEVSATLSYLAPEVPLISKAINPGTIVPGESALLTITLTNSSQALTNLALVDYFTVDGTTSTLPNGMKIADAPEATTTCAGGIVAATPDGTSVGLSGASLAADAACEVSVRITSISVGTLVNNIPVNSIETDQGATNSTSFAQSSLSTSSDLGVAKMFTPAVISPTESSTLRVTIYNARAEAITGLEITDTFPLGLLLAPEPNAFSNCGGSIAIDFPDPASVHLSGGSIGAAQGIEAASCYLEVDVVAADEGTYINVIPANSLLAGGNPVPHPEATARLEARERIIVNKAFDELTLDAGDPAGFATGVASRLPGVEAPLTIRLENPNDEVLTEVNFIDRLPDDLVLALVPELATTCTDGIVAGVPSGREIRLTGATLAAMGDAGAICTVTARVVSNIPGIYTNEIAVGDVKSFEGIDNNPATQAQIVIAEPPALSKTFSPPVVGPDLPTTLSIVIRNDNGLEMMLTADLVDNLPSDPAQMVVATSANITTTCPDGSGIVSADPGSTSVVIASGTVVPAEGCLVSVDVTAPLGGDYLNYIPVGALQSNFGTNLAPATAPLLVSTLGYISGTVFLDNQAPPDGNFIFGDSTPIPDNAIELRDGNDCVGDLLDTTNTDSQGRYLFSELAASTYSVCQPSQPAGTLNSVTQAGVIVPYTDSTGTVGVASNPPGGSPTSQILGIALNSGTNIDEVSGSPENDFSEVLPVSIAGNVYYDVSNDGVFDGDESGIGGVTITLTGPVTLAAVTNPDGSYSFANLPPGEYTVTETQPDGWTDGQDTAGNLAGVTQGDAVVDDVISSINLAPGDDGVQYDFGETLTDTALAITANAFCLQDTPYIDYGVADIAGLTGVTVEFFTEGGRLVQRLENQPASGTLLWPGAAADESGAGVSWPGWELLDGAWVQVPDDRIPGLTVRVSINPSAEEAVSYPPATPACITQPPGTWAPRAVPATPQGVLLLMSVLMMLMAGRRLQSGG